MGAGVRGALGHDFALSVVQGKWNARPRTRKATEAGSGGKGPNNNGGRIRAREAGKKNGQRRKRNKRMEKQQTEGKRNVKTDRGGKKQQNEGKRTKRMKREQNKGKKGAKKRTHKETSNRMKEKRNKKQGKQVKTKERETNDMKAEQKARKQEQNGTGRQRKHEVDSKKKEEALSVWRHEKPP